MRRIKLCFEFMSIEVSLKFCSRSDDKTYTRNRTETQHRVFPQVVLRGLYELSTSREIILLQPDHLNKLGQAKNR